MNSGAETDLDAVKARLLARRGDLRRLVAASAEACAPVELDQSRIGRLSRMNALQAQAMSIEAARRRNVELQRIDAALQRIADGEYGFCLACGAEIATKRLDFDPTIPVCIDCARRSGS